MAPAAMEQMRPCCDSRTRARFRRTSMGAAAPPDLPTAGPTACPTGRPPDRRRPSYGRCPCNDSRLDRTAIKQRTTAAAAITSGRRSNSCASNVFIGAGVSFGPCVAPERFVAANVKGERSSTRGHEMSSAKSTRRLQPTDRVGPAISRR